MARGRRVARGDVWLYEFDPPDKLRPVVILTREGVIPLLHSVMVAPVTTKIRGIPSEVLVGSAQGLERVSAVNLDHVQTVPKQRLLRRIGCLGPEEMQQVCDALAIAAGCSQD